MPEDFTLETVLPAASGGLYLVSSSRVLRMAPGEKPRPFADVGSSAGAAALGPDGALYLGRRDRVAKVSGDGTVQTVAEGFQEVFGVAVDAKGTLYVADWSAGSVVRLRERERKIIAKDLEHPSGLVVDPDGNVFVKESGRQTNEDMRVRRIAPDGTLTTFATVPSVSRFR